MSLDWKLMGYSISSLSVVLLGLAAWPGSTGRGWQTPAILAGAAFSILGMACRYVSHRRDRAAIAKAQRQASEGKRKSEEPESGNE